MDLMSAAFKSQVLLVQRHALASRHGTQIMEARGPPYPGLADHPADA
jgi:hypothetical protein